MPKPPKGQDIMKEMTSRQRLLAAIEGLPVDRIPVSPRIWRYAAWKNTTDVQLARQLGFDCFLFGIGCPVVPIHDALCISVAETIPEVEVTLKTGTEGEKTVAERTFRTPGGILTDVLVIPPPNREYGISPNPEWRERLIKARRDVELLPYLLPGPQLLCEKLGQARDLEDALGNRGLVAFRPATGVDQLVVDSIGPAESLMASLLDPEMLDRTVELVDRWYMGWMKLVLEDGWKILYDSFFNFSLSVGWSPGFYRDKVAPVIRRHAELVHRYGAKLFFYDDGKLAGSIGFVLDAGADIVQTLTPPPGGDLDFKWLAENHGGRACFNGGIDTVKIRFGKPEEIRQDVRDAIDVLAPTRRFILGTSDSITEGTPEENIRAFFSAAREHGRRAAKELYG